MLSKNRFIIMLSVFFLAGTFSACKKDWNAHDKVTDSNLANNLYQAISKTSNLSKFSAMLAKTGYDTVISSSKTYTVWVPTDAALASLDASITSDTTKLKLFVANHISNQSFLVGGADQRIKMLNGKYITLSGNTFDSANIVTANQYANNGIYHVIDKYILRYDNCWEFVKNTSLAPLMKTFLLSQNYNVFNAAIAKQTGVDASTGLPLYDSSTGYVLHNHFLDEVMDVSDESNQYTFVVLADNSFTTQLNQLTPYFKTSITDSTNRLASSYLVRDFAFKGLYTPSQLPDTMLSQYGVKVPLTKSMITASYKTSNGIVYVMSQVNFTLKYKFPSVYIQGENPTAFNLDRSSTTFYRIRNNPVTGLNFKDILVNNYNVANYFIDYYAGYLNSMRYNAYWVAVNDLQSTPLWTQQLKGGYVINASGSRTAYMIDTLPRVTIAYNNFNEVYLGQFSYTKYSAHNYFVCGPTTASSTGNVDAITLDYIRLEPAF
jgi:uncharacterized surface protein with fasciclin (FAS1) repeats